MQAGPLIIQSINACHMVDPLTDVYAWLCHDGS